MEDNKIKKQFRLSTDNEMHQRVNKFIKIYPPRLSQLVVIALLELMETYQLEQATPDDIIAFTDFYEYYRIRFKKDEHAALSNLGRLLSALPAQPSSAAEDSENMSMKEQNSVPPMQEETVEPLVSADERERMQAILNSSWGP